MILGIAMAFFLYTILVVRNFFKFQAVGIEKKNAYLLELIYLRQRQKRFQASFRESSSTCPNLQLSVEKSCVDGGVHRYE